MDGDKEMDIGEGTQMFLFSEIIQNYEQGRGALHISPSSVVTHSVMEGGNGQGEA